MACITETNKIAGVLHPRRQERALWLLESKKKIFPTELEYERKILHRDAEALSPGRAVPLDFIYKASQSVRNFKMTASEH